MNLMIRVDMGSSSLALTRGATLFDKNHCYSFAACCIDLWLPCRDNFESLSAVPFPLWDARQSTFGSCAGSESTHYFVTSHILEMSTCLLTASERPTFVDVRVSRWSYPRRWIVYDLQNRRGSPVSPCNFMFDHHLSMHSVVDTNLV